MLGKMPNDKRNLTKEQITVDNVIDELPFTRYISAEAEQPSVRNVAKCIISQSWGLCSVVLIIV